MDLRHLPGLGDVRYHRLESEILQRGFHIFVRLPESYAVRESERLPTVYLLDGGTTFPLLGAYYRYLSLAEEVPDMIQHAGDVLPDDLFGVSSQPPGRVMWLGRDMMQRQGSRRAVLRLMILAGVLLTSLPGLRSIAATPSGVADAIREQRLRLETAPRDVVVLNDLANLLVLAGEVEEAEELYQRALEIEPDRVPAIYNLASLQAETGRRKLAIQGFRKVLEIDPGHAWSHYQLGTLLAAAGKRNKAIGHYIEALSLEPNLARPEFNPHAIDNDLLLAALLQAHPSGSPANMVPRIYKDPEQVRALLFPPEAHTPGPAESDESASRSGGEIRSSGGISGAPAGAMDEPTVSKAGEPGRAGFPNKSAVPRSGTSAQGVVRRPLRPSEPRIRQPETPVPTPAPAGSSKAAAAGEAVPPQPAAKPPESPAPAPARSEGEQVFSSTGRLDLRLVPKPLPEPQDRLASLADATG